MFRFVRRSSIPLRSLALSAAAALALAPTSTSLRAQDILRADGAPAANWVKAAAANEDRIIEDDGTFPVRYRMHRIDSKGDIFREVIECREGTVARLVARNGKPITREQDQAERARLQEILADPTNFFKHQKRNGAARSYARQLVDILPVAMLYTYASGQPQPSQSTSPQVVLDFTPNPAFRPPNTVSELLTGLQGRMWIDRQSQHLTRVEARIIKPVNFGWGLLAHIFPGGTIEFEQADAGHGRWIYSHVTENITVREMMLHTSLQKADMTATDIRLLPVQISYRDAIHQLLDMQIPLR